MFTYYKKALIIRCVIPSSLHYFPVTENQKVYMFQAALRVIFIAMMLFVFFLQTLAFNTSIPCETSVEHHSSNVNEPVKHFDSTSENTDSSEDCCGIECCDLNCTCVANACSSIVYFNTEFNSTSPTTLNNVVAIQQSELPKSIATLLYRPPIFTS